MYHDFYCTAREWQRNWLEVRNDNKIEGTFIDTDRAFTVSVKNTGGVPVKISVIDERKWGSPGEREALVDVFPRRNKEFHIAPGRWLIDLKCGHTAGLCKATAEIVYF